MSDGLRRLSSQITYLPASDAPLSADVFFMETGGGVYVYDVGNCEEAKGHIAAAGREIVVVLSHFHADHTGNIGSVACRALYAGRETLKHVGGGIVVEDEVVLDPSIPIRLLPLASSHAKDCVVLCYGKEYAFCGDALYATGKRFPVEHTKPGGNGQAVAESGYVIKQVYNAQKLQAMLAALRGMDVKNLVLSHEENPVRPKEEVVRELEGIYQRRTKDSAYIVL